MSPTRSEHPFTIAALLRAAVLCLALVAALAPAAQARHGHTPETVIQDDALFLHGTDESIQKGLEQTRSLGITRVRLTAGWSVLAPEADSETKPALDLTDPANYPRDIWRNLDRAVRMTVAAGLRPMVDIAFWAPRWATKEQADQRLGRRTEIDAGLYAEFAEAVARRYSGTYAPPAPDAQQAPPPEQEPSPDRSFLDQLFKPQPTQQRQAEQAPPAPAPANEPLPAVDLFTIWNEPNHPGFLLPQWNKVNGKFIPRAPHLYRDMVRAAYPVIKRVAPQSKVLIGGTASMGSSTPGKSGVTPLLFLREFACVDENLKPITRSGCEKFDTIPGDGWSHHPYSLATLPDELPQDRDKLPVAATARLVSTLKALVKRGRLAPDVATVYMTEYGYETNKPDPEAKFTPDEQPRLLAWAEYLGTRSPSVAMWPQFQLVDRPGDPTGPRNRPFGDWQSGLIYADGTAKPAFHAFRTPAFASCRRVGKQRWIEIWGRVRGSATPVTATVEMRKRGASAAAKDGGWRIVSSSPVPRRGAAKAAQASAGAAGAAVTRFIPYATGLEVRLRWSAGDAAGAPTETLRATACPQTKRKAAAAKAKAAKKATSKKSPTKRAQR